jgi:hypothetical protein
MTTHPINPNRLALEAALMSLLTSLTKTLSQVHDAPAIPTTSLTTFTKSLAKYLTFFISRNKRRSRIPLDPANLAFDLLRTHNSSETTISANGKRIKGKKSWYYLVLTEVNNVNGAVQILVEGMIRREKGEVLDGFIEEVDDQVLFWEELENEEIEKGMKSEEMQVWVEMEKEVEEEREGKTVRRVERQKEVIRKGRDRRARKKKGGMEDIEEEEGGEGEGTGKSVGFVKDLGVNNV